MSRRLAWALPALSVAILGLLLVEWHRSREASSISALYQGWRPILKSAPILSGPALEQLLSADFNVVRTLRYVPPIVKQSFCNVQNCNERNGKFDMVEPGRTMSTDFLIPGVSQRRRVFAALNPKSAIVVFERGGYANFLCVSVFDFEDGSAWRAVLDNRTIRELNTLRSAIRESQFKIDGATW
jgi:hypothetical protein